MLVGKNALVLYPYAHSLSQIFYKSGRLRIAITTANLVPLDWRDIENVSAEKTPHPIL